MKKTMMRNVSLLSAVAIGIMLVTVQCSKKETNNSIDNSSPNSISTNQKLLRVAESDGLDMNIVKSDFDLARNDDNPYDYSGQIHYVGLKRLEAKVSEEETESFLDMSYDVLNDLMPIVHEKLGHSAQENLASLYSLVKDMKNNFTINPKTLGMEVTPCVLSRFEEISSLLKDLATRGDDPDKEAIISAIKQYEASLLENDQLDVIEMKPALVFTSTLRYSLIQWLPEYKQNIIEKDIVFYKTRKLKWWHWFVLAGSDAAGYALGNAAVGVAASKLAYEIIKDENKQ